MCIIASVPKDATIDKPTLETYQNLFEKYFLKSLTSRLTDYSSSKFDVLGVDSDHIAIRTSYYSGMGERNDSVQVYGLSYLIKKLESEDSLLIVDDVFDTGKSINQIILDLKTACKKNTPEIRIATPYFKPSQNKTERKPDYYLHETDKWLVFPHELEGLSAEEIIRNKPELKDLLDKITPKL